MPDQDALVERLAEAIAEAGTDFNPWADPHAPGNAEWFAHYRDLARAVLPIVEDHAKARYKAGAVEALREVEAACRTYANYCVNPSHRSGVDHAVEIIASHSRDEAS